MQINNSPGKLGTWSTWHPALPVMSIAIIQHCMYTIKYSMVMSGQRWWLWGNQSYQGNEHWGLWWWQGIFSFQAAKEGFPQDRHWQTTHQQDSSLLRQIWEDGEYDGGGGSSTTSLGDNSRHIKLTSMVSWHCQKQHFHHQPPFDHTIVIVMRSLSTSTWSYHYSPTSTWSYQRQGWHQQNISLAAPDHRPLLIILISVKMLIWSYWFYWSSSSDDDIVISVKILIWSYW